MSIIYIWYIIIKSKGRVELKEFYILGKEKNKDIVENSAKYIKDLRKYSKLTQERFCDLYHIPYSTLRDWENDRRKPTPYLIELMWTRVVLDFEHASKSRERNDVSSVREFYLIDKIPDGEICDKTREISRELRKTANLSQDGFGQLYHIPSPTISAWELQKNSLTPYLAEFLYTRVMLDFKNN